MLLKLFFKHDHEIDTAAIMTKDGTLFKENLRASKTHYELMRKFYANSNLTDEQFKKIDGLIDQYLGVILKDDSTIRNVKWSIRKLMFDNTFAYGKGNIINFDNMSGITGIFGRNRLGKSSIPGTLMYSLFNSTDRGHIKNLHIVNSRKGHCKTSIEISLGGKLYTGLIDKL